MDDRAARRLGGDRPRLADEAVPWLAGDGPDHGAALGLRIAEGPCPGLEVDRAVEAWTGRRRPDPVDGEDLVRAGADAGDGEGRVDELAGDLLAGDRAGHL